MTNERGIGIGDVAPVIRGLTFDGEKGKIVLFSAKVPDAERIVRAGGVTVELSGLTAKEAVERLAAAFNERPGVVPVIACPPLGCFYVGESFDTNHTLKEALERTETGGEPADAITAAAPHPEAERERNSGARPFGAEERGRIVAGKVAIVTGGAQGFGEEIVRYLVNGKCHVFIADLNEKGAERLALSLNEELGQTLAFPVGVDIGSEESVRTMIDEVVRTLGGVDLFVSNAGVLKAGSVKELAAKDFEFVTKVNYEGYFLCTKWVARIMALQNRPSGSYYTDIIQINSKSGLEGSNRNGAYSGSKFGGIGLTQSFALELVGDNIKVNSICPGNFLDGPLWSDPDRGLFVQYLRAGKVPGAKSVEDVKRYYEERVPMRRGCTGADVIKAIFYVIEQKYETGQAIPVTGGQVMLS